MHTTPVSLLERLRQPNESDAWHRMVDLYTPLLFHWARRFGLAEQDAADLVQDVLVTLVKQLPTFAYQPGQRFRGWLWTVTLNTWRARQRRLGSRPTQDDPSNLETIAAPEEPDLAESEYQRYLFNRALELMRADFEEATWKACWELVVADRSAAEVAAELNLTVNAVYLAKARVLRRLRQELAGLVE